MKKRILSLLLCLCMICSLLPAMQLVAQADTPAYNGMKGSGTAADPYQVCTSSDINAMATTAVPAGTYFRQMNDIEYPDIKNQKTADSTEFNGVFDGATYKITNILLIVNEAENYDKIFQENNRSIFPVVGKDGVLKNLTLEARGAGGTLYGIRSGYSFLVHTNYGTIQNVHMNSLDLPRSASTYGVKDVAGLVCYNEVGGLVLDCSIGEMLFGSPAPSNSNASGVNGEVNMGGFVAVNRGTVEDCAIETAIYKNRWMNYYSTTTVTMREEKNSCIGGAVGINYGTVKNVYVGYKQQIFQRNGHNIFIEGDIQSGYYPFWHPDQHTSNGQLQLATSNVLLVSTTGAMGLGAVVGENRDGGKTENVTTAVYGLDGKTLIRPDKTYDQYEDLVTNGVDATFRYNQYLVGGSAGNTVTSVEPTVVATDYYNAITVQKTAHYTINLADKAGNILQTDIVRAGDTYTVPKYYTPSGTVVESWIRNGTTYKAGDVISANNVSSITLTMNEPIALNQDNWKDYLTITWPSAAYNGTAKTITLAPKEGQVELGGTATVEYWLRGVKVTTPTDAGTYTLKLTGLTGNNYAFDADTTEITLGTMTIQPASTNISVSASKGTVKFREFTTLTATLTNNVTNGAPFRGKVVFHVGPTYTFTGSLTSDGTATYTYDWVASSYYGGGYLWAEYVPSEDDCYDSAYTRKDDPWEVINVTKGDPIDSDFSYSSDAILEYTYPEAIPSTPAGLGITPNSDGWGSKASFSLVFKNAATGTETKRVSVDGKSTLPGGTYAVWVKNTGTADWFLSDSITDTGLVLTVNSKAPSRVMFVFNPSTFNYALQGNGEYPWSNVVDEADGSGLTYGQAAPVYYKDGVKAEDKSILDAGTYECYGHVIDNSSYDTDEETYLGQITVVKSDISGIAQYMFDVTLPGYSATIYNGKPQEATLAQKTTGTYSAYTGYGEATLHYYSDEAMTQEVQPINAQTDYYVGLMVSGGENFYPTTKPISFGKFMIKPAELQATLTNPYRYFGQADAKYEITLAGFPEGKNESDLQGAPYVYFNPYVTLGSGAGEYDYELYITDPNYYLKKAAGNAEKFTIKALDTQELTIEGIPTKMVVGESFSPRLTYQGQTLTATFTSSDTNVLYQSNVDFIAKTPGTITLTGAPLYDYQGAKTLTGTLEIKVVAKNEDANITVTFPEGDASLPYTGEGIKYEKATLTGAPKDSTLTYSYVRGSEYNNTGVLKNGLPLEVGKYIVTATYTAEDGSAISAKKDLTITPAVLQVEVGSFQWMQDYYGNVYNGYQEGELIITGIVPGDDIAVSVKGLPLFPDANVSANPQDVTVDLFLQGADTYKYTLAQTAIVVPGIINPIGTHAGAGLSVYGAYGKKLSELTISGYAYPDNDNRGITGTWSYQTDENPVLKPGNTREFTLTFTPDSLNYKPLSVKVTPRIYPVSYDGTKSVTKDVYLSGPLTGKVLDVSSTLEGIPGATITAVQLGTTYDFVTRAYLKDGKIVIDANEKTGYTSTIKACITSDDYADFTLTIDVRGKAKTDAGVSIPGETPDTKTYGDASFDITAAVTAAGEGTGVWTWESDDDTVLSVSGDTATATVTVLKAGSATITATYESESTKGVATKEITVSPKTVTVTAGTYKVSKVYDGTLTPGTGSGDLTTDILDADSTVTVTATPVDYTDANVGGQTTMTVTLALEGDTDGNYTLGTTTLDVPCKITPATLTAADTATATADYGTAVKDITITDLTAKLGEDTVAGSWAFAADEDTVPNVGDTGAFTATFTPDANAENYQTLTKDIVPTINKVTYSGNADAVVAVPANFAKNGVTVDMNGRITGILGAAVKSAAVKFNTSGLIDSSSVTINGNVVTFNTTSVESSSGDAIAVIISSTNYNDFEAVITLQTENLDDAGVSFTGTVPTAKTYGDPTFTLTAEKTAEGDGVWTWTSSNSTVLSVSGTGATATVTVLKPGSATISATFESETAIGVVNAPITVSPKTITVEEGNYEVSKVYDKTTNPGTATGALTVNGILDADTTVKVTATPVAYTSKDVGGQAKMNVTLALSGEGSENYTLNGVTTLDVDCEITPAALTVEGTATATAPYGTALKNIPIKGLTVTSGHGTVTGTWAFTGETILSVGNTSYYEATFTPDDGIGNYRSATIGIVPTITKADYDGVALTLTQNVLTNQAQTGLTVDLTSLISHLEGATVTGASETADEGNLISNVATLNNKVTFDVASIAEEEVKATIDVTISSTNYNDIHATITVVTVTKSDAQVSFTGTVPTAKTYGDDTFTLAASAANLGTGDGVWTWTSSDPTVLSVSGTGATATVTVLKPGSATITAKYESDTTLDSAQTATITVGKATLTIQAIDRQITVGAEAPNLASPVRDTDYTVTGLVGDDVAPTGVSLEYQRDGQPVEVDTGSAGTYDIVVTNVDIGAGDSFYTIEKKVGTLTISQPAPSMIFYPITAGENGKYTIGSSQGLSFTSTGALTKFRSAAVDGKTLDAKTYALKGDSTNISLTAAYLDTLSVGTHSLRIEFSDGYSTAKFTIVKKAIVNNPFIDVHESDYFYNAVLWAVEEEVTSGTSPTTFSPNNDCTRAQAVTFLWRAMGKPEPTKTENPFSDVSESAYYYKAVLWAVEKGITAGTSATLFSPDETCTRSQVVAFLWRAQEKPTVNYAMNFTDVPAASYYTEAVRWAVSEGITTGTGDKTFSPNDDCTRGQIVTFLHRWVEKRLNEAESAAKN